MSCLPKHCKSYWRNINHVALGLLHFLVLECHFYCKTSVVLHGNPKGYTPLLKSRSKRIKKKDPQGLQSTFNEGSVHTAFYGSLLSFSGIPLRLDTSPLFFLRDTHGFHCSFLDIPGAPLGIPKRNDRAPMDPYRSHKAIASGLRLDAKKLQKSAIRSLTDRLVARGNSPRRSASWDPTPKCG